MMQRLIFVLILLPSTLTAWTQSRDYKSSYKKAEKLFDLDDPSKRSDSIAAVLYLEAASPALAEKDGKIAVGSLIRAATIRQTHQQYKEACDLYNKALLVNLTYFHDTILLYEACLYLGSAYYQQGITDSAKFYFEKASQYTSHQPGNDSFPEQERLYNSLGAIYYESANYTQAMNYFQKALEFDGRDKETQVTLQSNIANCLVQTNRYDEGITMFKSLLPSGFLKRTVLHNIAHTFFEINKYDSALHYFSKVSRKNDEVTIRMLNDLGRIFAEKGNYHTANKVLDSSLAISNSISGKLRSRDRAVNYLVRSILSERQNESNEAMKWCNIALTELQMESNKPGDQFREVNTISPLLSLDIFKHKASLLEKEYTATKSAASLQSCFDTWLKAIHVANYIRRYLDHDEAKMYFQQDQGSIYYEAIRIGFALNDIKKDSPVVNELIDIMESYKGNILFENIQQAVLKSGSKIPAWIREKERSLKQALSSYTIKLGNAGSGKQAADLKQKIINARVELSRLQKQYEQHPEYDFYKQDTSTTDYRKKLTAALDNKTALLCYISANDNIYALAITKNSFKTHIIHLTPGLIKVMVSFNNEVYQHIDGKRYGGALPGTILYKEIVQPFENFLERSDKLVILPDGMLNYIPFEALAVSADSRDYFLLQKTISYHYSISLLLYRNEKTKLNVEASAPLFFAPFASENTVANTANLSILPFSLNEGSGEKMNKWVGERATKNNLLRNIGSNRIIHLATHAKSGMDGKAEALIYFYPADTSEEVNNLYLEEIYSLELRNTDLVILSACETAGGMNTAGEGLLSLSRGFMYAGSKGMISTLWKTEDQVSAMLMQLLYMEMEKGYPVEEALQKAKIQFLEDETVSEKYKTPNYWANFIYVGKTGDNLSNKKSSWVYIAAILLVGVIIYMIAKNRKLPRHSGVASGR